MQIIVNGQSKVLPSDAPLDYIEVVSLADVDVGATVTYRKAKNGAEGTLTKGQKVEPAEGMIVNVADTGNA